MYEQKLWQDHVTEFEDRYTESRNDDGTITHTPVEGEIIQQGTPQNATNFNHMENGISNATETAALMALSTIHHQQARDYEVSLDICIDEEDGVVIGTGGKAQKYAAQIVIPARRYDVIEDGEDENGEPKEIPVPIPFDMSLCTLILWGLEV